METIPIADAKARRSVYRTSPISRKRRSADDLERLLEAALGIINSGHKLTIRHLFYRLVGLRAIEKTEAAYKSLCAHLSKWRRSGHIPWSAFTDNTRWYIGDSTFDSVEEALNNTASCYRRNLWSNQSAHVEIWTEKDAISAILNDEARMFGVPVFTCRGFASLTSLHTAAEMFRAAVAAGKEVFIYHFGDFDPSGMAIDRAVTNTLADDFNVNVRFTRRAVLESHIIEHNLPTRPVKKSDGRSAGWKTECVEVDTMPPELLKSIVKDSIVQHIDPHAWEQTRAAEAMERETLAGIASNFGGAR